MIETLKPAVERYNAAKPGMQVYDAKDEIDKVLRNTVRNLLPSVRSSRSGREASIQFMRLKAVVGRIP